MVSGPAILIGAEMVNEKALVLSTRIPKPAVPLMVFPWIDRIKLPGDDTVTFCATPFVIHTPPTEMLPLRTGWLVKVPLKTALSPADGLVPPNQFPPVFQSVDVWPVQE